MTDCDHNWGEWELAYHYDDDTGTKTATGDRARECVDCGRWEVEWNDDDSTQNGNAANAVEWEGPRGASNTPRPDPSLRSTEGGLAP